MPAILELIRRNQLIPPLTSFQQLPISACNPEASDSADLAEIKTLHVVQLNGEWNLQAILEKEVKLGLPLFLREVHQLGYITLY